MDENTTIEAEQVAAVDEGELWDEIEAAEKAGPEPREATQANDDFPADDGDGQGNEPSEPAEEGGEPAEPAAAVTEPPAQDRPDIWANATPEQLAAYEAIKQSADSNRGRVSALQRKINDLARGKPAAGQQPPASPVEALERLKEDYPELAEPLAEAFGRLEARLGEHDRAEQGRQQAAIAELDSVLEQQEQALDRVHPGWADFLHQNKSAYEPWIDDQPRHLRDAHARNIHAIVDAAEAAEVIAAFKVHLNGGRPAPATANPQPSPRLTDRRARQLSGTASPRSGHRPTVSGIPEDGDAEMIWNMFDAQERAEARA